MIFEQNHFLEKLGQKAGYLFSYLVFTAILFFLLRFLKRLPEDWHFFHIACLVFCIVISGEALKRILR